MQERNTIVINIIGGPGCGKSTQCAALYAELKQRGVSVEMITEVVKDYIYERNGTAVYDQLKLFAETLYKMNNLYGKVDVIINDGSLLNNCIYDKSHNMLFHSLVIQEYQKFRNIDFFLLRDGIEFTQEGRIHDEEQSIELDKKIKDVYAFAGATYFEIPSKNAAQTIIQQIQSLGEDQGS